MRIARIVVLPVAGGSAASGPATAPAAAAAAWRAALLASVPHAEHVAVGRADLERLELLVFVPEVRRTRDRGGSSAAARAAEAAQAAQAAGESVARDGVTGWRWQGPGSAESW